MKNLIELFSEECEVGENFKGKGVYIDHVVTYIKETYGIEASKDELMVEIQSRLVINLSGKPARKHFLTIEPTQSLLEKFREDYPHFLI